MLEQIEEAALYDDEALKFLKEQVYRDPELMSELDRPTLINTNDSDTDDSMPSTLSTD